MIISSRQKVQSLKDYSISINVDGIRVNQTLHSKSLGLNIVKISLGGPTYMTSRKTYRQVLVCRLKRVRPFVSMHTAVKIYGMVCQLSDKLQKTTKSRYQSYHQIMVPFYGNNLPEEIHTANDRSL